MNQSFLGGSLAVLACLVFLLSPQLVFGQDPFGLEGLKNGPAQDLPQGGEAKVQSTIENAINLVLGFVGILAACAIIWGGVTYILSLGSDQRVETAKKTLIYAVIGLVLVGISALIVNVVIDAVK